MISTHGTYRAGAVVLDGPVPLPDGAQVRVMLDAGSAVFPAAAVEVCCDGSTWDDSAAGARCWTEWFDALEPILTEREFQEWEAQRLAEKERQQSMAAQESERIATIFP
jgi:hypothetical protein